MKFKLFLKIRRKRRKKKALKKVEDAVRAFIYIDKAMKLAGFSRQKRKQFKRDLIAVQDPELILLRFLEEVKRIKIRS